MQRFQETGVPNADAAPLAPPPGVRPTLVAAAATLGICVFSPLIAWSAGDGTWYALPLFVGLLAFWRRGGLGLRTMGFRSAKGFYRVATLHPLLVVSGAVWLSMSLGAMRVANVGAGTLALQISSMVVVSFVGTLVR